MLRRFISNVIEGTFPQSETSLIQNPVLAKDNFNLEWLASIAPCFPIKPNSIKILNEPSQFYNELLHQTTAAKKRITLASLYLGSGSLEKSLIDKLMKNEYFLSGGLKVNILLDYTRGSRLRDNSRKTLQPLLQLNEQNCSVSLYHTPYLRGIFKKYVPHRYNEVFGLQHMKLYIFDDTLIISGANLSNDYFTNRQDRYFVINDKSLCDFYCGLVSKVEQFSLKMDKNNNASLHNSWDCSPYEGSKGKFIAKARGLIEGYLWESIENQEKVNSNDCDTWVFPLIQMGQLGIEHDSCVTTMLLSDAPKGSQLNIASGYFNLTSDYMDVLIKHCQANCKILMAHPKANGFLGANGLAGGIPWAYSLIARNFNNRVEKFGQTKRIQLLEYLKEGWTYHAKGLWYYPPKSPYPSLSLIGSPNFGERSVKKDLETQLAIVTKNKSVQKALHEECCRLYKLGSPADVDRPVPKWVYAFVYLFRSYF